MPAINAVNALKTCCVCGTDCTTVDRTKDTKGRYFCMGCFSDLLKRKQRGERIVLPAPPSQQRDERPGEQSGERSGLQDSLGGSTLSDCSGSQGTLAALSLSADSPLLLTDAGAAPDAFMPAAPRCAACPRCAALLPPSAAICLQCGTNVRTGRRLATRCVRSGESLWPGVLGSIALLFAVALLALTGLQTYGVLTQSVAGPRVVGQVGALLIQACFAIWHAAGALDTFRQRALGVHRLRLSSAIWLALLTVATTARVSLVVMLMDPSPARHALLDSIAIGTLVAAAWPLVVVVWTSHRAVQREVGTWR